MAEQIKAALIRRKQVEQLTCRSRAAIYAGMKAGTFPPSVKIGIRAVAWRVEDVMRWVENPAGYRAPGFEEVA